MKVLRYGYMKEVMCTRGDVMLNRLFNFEPMKGDLKMFESVGNSTCMSILNMLKALNFSDG